MVSLTQFAFLVTIMFRSRGFREEGGGVCRRWSDGGATAGGAPSQRSCGGGGPFSPFLLSLESKLGSGYCD